ncbi:MAG: thioredoxin family protein [Candidatus Krumholzibacteriia bacterium]
MRHLNATIILMIILLAGAALAGVTPGGKAPDFTLTDTTGETHTLSAYLAEGKIVVLEWFNPDCPFIKKHHQDHRTMDETLAAYKDRDVVWLAINSGAEGKQGAGLERNKKAVKDFKMSFPVLLDPDGAVGRAYGAKKTPHMFVVTTEGVVAYMGAIDDDAGVQALGETNHVVAALDEILAGKPVTVTETDSYGCSVKYAD